MFFLLIKALLLHPKLLRQHIANYVAWLQAEARYSVRHLLIALCAWLIGAVCFLLASVLAGVAIMLGFLYNQFHWVLVIVPSVPLVKALLFFVVAIVSQSKLKGLDRFKQQIQEDIALFKRLD